MLEFRGEPRQEQLLAARAILAHDTGVLSATTAFGKTVVAAWLIAQRRVNTLVLVHRRQLLEQWVERLSTFLDLPPKSIGHIGGGRKKPTGLLDVALIQSLVRKGVVDDRVGEYGHVIVDECHHSPARGFEQVVRRAKAKYITGLSATVARKDGHRPIIFMQCGSVRHRVDAREQAAARPFAHTVLVRPTTFRPLRATSADMRIQFHDL
jgi:superfamily II DNA or RNA helicase